MVRAFINKQIIHIPHDVRVSPHRHLRMGKTEWSFLAQVNVKCLFTLRSKDNPVWQLADNFLITYKTHEMDGWWNVSILKRESRIKMRYYFYMVATIVFTYLMHSGGLTFLTFNKSATKTTDLDSMWDSCQCNLAVEQNGSVRQSRVLWDVASNEST